MPDLFAELYRKPKISDPFAEIMSLSPTGPYPTEEERKAGLQKAISQEQHVLPTASIKPLTVVLRFEKGEKAKKHFNPGNIQYGEYAKKFGAVKGEAYVDSQGVKRYHAKFPSWEQGFLATTSLVDSLWEKTGGDPLKFATTYTGLPADSDTVKNMVQMLEAGVSKEEAIQSITTPQAVDKKPIDILKGTGLSEAKISKIAESRPDIFKSKNTVDQILEKKRKREEFIKNNPDKFQELKKVEKSVENEPPEVQEAVLENFYLENGAELWKETAGPYNLPTGGLKPKSAKEGFIKQQDKPKLREYVKEGIKNLAGVGNFEEMRDLIPGWEPTNDQEARRILANAISFLITLPTIPAELAEQEKDLIKEKGFWEGSYQFLQELSRWSPEVLGNLIVATGAHPMKEFRDPERVRMAREMLAEEPLAPLLAIQVLKAGGGVPKLTRRLGKGVRSIGEIPVKVRLKPGEISAFRRVFNDPDMVEGQIVERVKTMPKRELLEILREGKTTVPLKDAILRILGKKSPILKEIAKETEYGGELETGEAQKLRTEERARDREAIKKEFEEKKAKELEQQQILELGGKVYDTIESQALARHRKAQVKIPEEGEAKELDLARMPEEKVDRNKALARAHILQKELHISDDEAKTLKQDLFSQSTLKGLTGDQIRQYVDLLKDRKKVNEQQPKQHQRPQSARDYLAKKVIDLPGRTVDWHNHKFKDPELAKSQRLENLMRGKKGLKESEVRRFFRNISGTERYFEFVQRRTGVPVYDKFEDLMTRYHDFRTMVQKHREKIFPEARHMTEEDGNTIKSWLIGADVDLTPAQKKVAKAIKSYYDDPLVQTILKVNRFHQWYQNSSNYPLPGVDKDELQSLKKIYEDKGPEALIEAIKNTEGFLRKGYAPDISEEPSTLSKFIGVGKGLLKPKEGQGTEGDAISDFIRKVRSDFKILLLDEPIRGMANLLDNPALPKSVKKDMANFLRNLNSITEEGSLDSLIERGISAIVKPALTTFRAWLRNFPQRFIMVAYARTVDMPKIAWEIARITARKGGPAKVQVNKTFIKAPDHVKRYFISRVSELLSLEQELLGMRRTPILDRLGKFGDLLRPVFGVYGGVDTGSRWADFWTAYKEVKKQLDSGKPFKKVREKIFWHEIPRELRNILRAELDNGNKEYVALRIAENMATIKTQFRYGIYEKSLHEQTRLGHAALRVTTFPRSWIQNRIDDAKIFYEGLQKKDLKKAIYGLKALIASILVAYFIKKYYMDKLFGKGSYYSQGYNPLVMGELDVGSLLGEVLSWAEVPSDTIHDVNTLISSIVDGGLSETERDKIINRMAVRLTSAADKISYQTIVGYRQVLWILEAVLDKEKIRPLTNAYGKLINNKHYQAKDIERDALNKMRMAVFGSEEKKPKVKHSKRKEKPNPILQKYRAKKVILTKVLE